MLIALTSPAAGSGKSTVADYLVEKHGFVRFKFADVLKNMLRAMMRDIGYGPEETELYIEGPRKPFVIPELGVPMRHLMQTLGTEWGRDCIRQDLWVHLAVHRMKVMLDAGYRVVIDDMRFLNENARVRELGGICVRVLRSGLVVDTGHRSEGELDHVPMLEILNDGSIDDLHAQIEQLMWGWTRNSPSP